MATKRIEKRQIKMQQDQNAEIECVSTGGTTDGEKTGPWSKYALALQDENNLLEPDEEWLPENAQREELFWYILAQIQRIKLLDANGSDVSRYNPTLGFNS